MAQRQAELALAGFIETTAAPALRALPFPDLGIEGDPIYVKLLAAAFLPLAGLLLLVAIARGRLTLHRFLGLYIVLFLVACGSSWLNHQIVRSEAGAFTTEAVLHHVLTALLVASLHFALQRPGFPRTAPPSGTLYVRIWGAALSLLAFGYASTYFPQRQFLYARLLATLAFPLFGVQYLVGGHLIVSFGMKGFSTTISTLLPLIYSLLTVSAAYQLGFVRFHSDSVMGIRFFGMPVEEIASYAQLCTIVVQALLIWEGLAAPMPQRRQEVRARLVPMSSAQPKSVGAAVQSSIKSKAAHSDPNEGKEKKNKEEAPTSPSTTPAGKAQASPSISGSPKPKNSPQGAKKRSTS